MKNSGRRPPAPLGIMPSRLHAGEHGFPPFTIHEGIPCEAARVMEEDGIENNFPATLRTRETADLFVTLILTLLRERGRAAVVLPDGFFLGEGVKRRVKEKLPQECNLHTIVRLPNGVFNPYTGIKTNLLFLTKGPATEHIWYYEHPYPEGVKSYNKTRPVRFEEFQPEIDWWGNEADSFAGRVETEQAWKVSIDEIKARTYNLDIKNPRVPEQVGHDPEELLRCYAEQQEEIGSTREQLKNVLADAFKRTGLALADRIIDSFHIWTTAQASKTNGNDNGNGPYGIKRLRQLILELAVLGKLLPQDPNDEPASLLLEKIAKEKARLIREGKIKKQKAVPEITPSEKPFDLAQGWEWASLSHLGVFSSGKTPSTPKIVYWNGDIPWVTPKDMKASQVTDIEDHITPAAVDGGLSLCEAEALLFVVRSGILRRSFPVAVTKVPCTVNQDLKVLSLHLKDLSSYILLMMKGFEEYILRNLTKSGMTVESIVFHRFSQHYFMLPPLAEQHRIVAKVDELMGLCDTLENRLKDAQTIQVRLADAIVEQAAGL